MQRSQSILNIYWNLIIQTISGKVYLYFLFIFNIHQAGQVEHPAVPELARGPYVWHGQEYVFTSYEPTQLLYIHFPLLSHTHPNIHTVLVIIHGVIPSCESSSSLYLVQWWTCNLMLGWACCFSIYPRFCFLTLTAQILSFLCGHCRRQKKKKWPEKMIIFILPPPYCL